jgi:hypothetical protein
VIRARPAGGFSSVTLRRARNRDAPERGKLTGGAPVGSWRQLPLDLEGRRGHTSLAAQGRRIEIEAAPIRYVAQLIGPDTDRERAIPWLMARMVPSARDRPNRGGIGAAIHSLTPFGP